MSSNILTFRGSKKISGITPTLFDIHTYALDEKKVEEWKNVSIEISNYSMFTNTELAEKSTGTLSSSVTICQTRRFIQKRTTSRYILRRSFESSGLSALALLDLSLRPQLCIKPNTWKKTSKITSQELIRNLTRSIQE